MTMTDLIRRADAIEAICMNDCGGCRPNECGAYLDKSCDVVKVISALPSAEGGDAEMNETKPQYMQSSPNNGADLIRRADAIEAVCDVVMDEFNTSATWGYDVAEKAIEGLPPAEAVQLCDDCTRCTVKALNRQSAEAEDRLYIKIYADDEPSVKAEKLYQICGETQNREVTEWLKEYFPAETAQGEWIIHGDPPWVVRECSQCGTKWHHWSGGANPNYCGHCGARMKGGGSE